jgi:hypothetical protein
MKRVAFFSFFIFHFSFLSISQTEAIPNGGFEKWKAYPNTVYDMAEGWTDNDLLYQRFDPGYRGITVVKTTRSHSGKYALQMGIDINHGDTVNGSIYSIGNTDSLLHVIFHTSAAGFKCSQKYANLTGYYIFDCLPGDTAVFGAVLTRWNWATRKRDTIVNSILRIGDLHADYVPFVVPLKYRIKKEVPDTAFISVGIQSGGSRATKIGTVLIVDDLDFSGRADDEPNERR